ncbi:MAG TPA: heme o synthase [Terriglobales bacterium]|nr:heme o synthase [Terriglobales bacterium]
MSTATPSISGIEQREDSLASRSMSAVFADYAQLMKLRVTMLVVASSWCGYFMAALKSGVPSVSWQLVNTLFGIGIVSGGAAAVNQALEHDIDARMRRTQTRPLPSGRMAVLNAAIFGGLLITGGSIFLAFATNLLTGYLAFATAAAYLLFYTPLKPLTSICTLVGAFPGAMPALLGWTAVRGRIEWGALALFAIVLLWQFPHFFSIAWLYAEDYAAGGIRMLPVVEKDGRSTTREILLYSLSLIPVSLGPVVLGMNGPTYLAGALILSLGYFWFGLRLRRLHLPPCAPESKKTARQLLQASIIYLPLLFALMTFTAAFHF